MTTMATATGPTVKTALRRGTIKAKRRATTRTTKTKMKRVMKARTVKTVKKARMVMKERTVRTVKTVRTAKKERMVRTVKTVRTAKKERMVMTVNKARKMKTAKQETKTATVIWATLSTKAMDDGDEAEHEDALFMDKAGQGGLPLVEGGAEVRP
jgi:myo-inositol-1-phosphate synthase